MKTTVMVLVAVATLAGCAVAPAASAVIGGVGTVAEFFIFLYWKPSQGETSNKGSHGCLEE